MAVWKRVVALIVLLWLPLQGLAAVAMPFCAGATDAPLAADIDTGGEHGHHGNAGGGPSHHDDDHHTKRTSADSGFPLTCNDCGPCHLACAPAAVSAEALAVVVPVNGERPLGEPSKPRGFIPEQPHRPPLLRR